VPGCGPTSRRELRLGRDIAICRKAFASLERLPCHRRMRMGKYLLAWLLGVPAGLLVLVYLFTHL
jgi:hypothetical protein